MYLYSSCDLVLKVAVVSLRSCLTIKLQNLQILLEGRNKGEVR